jgi:hypothetical protein
MLALEPGQQYAGKKLFATNADQGKEVAQVAEHKDLGSSLFRNKKKNYDWNCIDGCRSDGPGTCQRHRGGRRKAGDRLRRR